MVVLIKHQRTLAFAVVWLTYCVTYFLRKPLGIVKPELGAHLHLSKSQLGWLDLALLLPYALVQVALSWALDATTPRKVISGCLIVAGMAMFIFCLSRTFWLTVVCLLINGAAQAPIWPSCTKAVSSWYPSTCLGSVFGAMGTAPYAGAFISTAVAIYIQNRYDWEWVFVPFSSAAILVAMVVFSVLKSPQEEFGTTELLMPEPDVGPVNKGSWIDLLRIPGVLPIAIALFCLKFVRYALNMWLPMYLSEHLALSALQAGFFSTIFDVGGIVGGPLLGVWLDRFHSERALYGVFQVTLLGCGAFMLLSMAASFGASGLVAALFLAGVANCGPDSILTGSVTMTLGDKFGNGVGAGVTSLVNGFGTFGGIVEGPVIGILSHHIGWNSVMACMIIMATATSVATLVAHQVLVKAEERRSGGDKALKI